MRRGSPRRRRISFFFFFFFLGEGGFWGRELAASFPSPSFLVFRSL